MKITASIIKKMSHHDDNIEQQRNHRKRSRWNGDNDDEDYDDGEIPESDSIVDDDDNDGPAKRRRLATTTLSDSLETRHYSGVEEVVTKYNSGVTGDGGKNLNNKKTREELERERQIRMAAIRGETEIEGTSHQHLNSNNNHTTQPQDALVSNQINDTGHQKNKKKVSKKNSGDVVNHSKTADHLGGTKVDGDYNDDDEEEDEDDETAKAMEELFGITNFGSTKNTKVITNHTSAAMGTIAKHLKPRKYRQYMNRKNGFNRPLDNV